MKNILCIKILCVIVMLLAACTTTNPFLDEPESVAEVQSIQTQFNRAQTIASHAWQITPTRNDHQGLVTWQFTPYKGLSINIPNGILDIQPANNDFITVKSFNDPRATLEATPVEKTLTIKINPVLGGKVVLYLPPETNYLILRNMEQIESLDLKPLYLNIINSSNVNFQTRNWMLEHLYLTDVQQASFEGITTPYLLTWINRSHKINISGMMSLRELDINNSTAVNIYRISSPILTVKQSGNSSAFLAGRTTVSNIKMRDASALDARYMSSERLFINTAGTSQAQVHVTQELNALANEWSLIGYYNQPTTLSRYYTGSGSILYLGENPPECILPYCPSMPHVLPG